MTAERRPGRPPRGSDQRDTRAAILESARAEFAAKGFERASLRAIARAAGVDSALVHHYFGSKDGLMIAALALPIDPRQLAPELLAGGIEELPARLAHRFLEVWESEEQRQPLVAMVRSAATTESAADLLRSGWARMIIEPIATALGTPDARLRAEMVVTQLIGLAMGRYIIKIEPLASADPDDVAERLTRAVRCALED